jgi:endoglycosylceramidase
MNSILATMTPALWPNLIRQAGFATASAKKVPEVASMTHINRQTGRTMWILLVCVGVLLLLALGQASAATAGFARTQGPWIVDADGRVLMLHGVNLSGSAKQPPFLPWANEDEVTVLHKWGFDSVRYLIVWEAVEPRPGQYNDAYLDEVAKRLNWCREAGLKVVLDMHQDLYARKYNGDGAPEWACLDEGIAYTQPPGGWFMAYLHPAVIKVFDNFYANTPGPGGVGIQDRFVAMWQHVAKRFRNDTNIIGYNIINEPSYGSAFTAVMGGIAVAATKELGPEATTLFTNPAAVKDPTAAIAAMIQGLIKKDALFKVLDEASPPAQQFERTTLQPFYNRAVAAIREVDPDHVIFFDPPAGDMSGTRMPSALEAPRDGDGKPFPNVVFSPHFYDFSSDFDFKYQGTVDYIRQFLGRAKAAGDRMGVPTWYGEWGIWTAQANDPDGAVLAGHHVAALNQLLCGWAYWDYGRHFKNFSFLPLLTQPYASVIAGVPTRMTAAEDGFELDFTPQERGGETVIWVPPTRKAEVKVELTGQGEAKSSRDAAGFVHITCPPGAGACSVRISWPR